MSISLTDFWIKRPPSLNYTYDNFTIKSNWSCSTNSIYIGQGKSYVHTENGYQLIVVLVDNTFYLDFAYTSYTRDVIEQQIWILNCIENPTVEYKIEFVSLWEKFNLPTPEQLNAFAQMYKERLLNPVVEVSAIEDTSIHYTEALNFLRLSTGLGEVELCRNMGTSLSEYLYYITNFIHTLSNEDVVQYATIIYNHHNRS